MKAATIPAPPRPIHVRAASLLRRTAKRSLTAALPYLNFPRVIWVAAAARKSACAQNGPAMEFDTTGRRFGWRLLCRGKRKGVEYLLHPLESVRYVEFAFVNDCLPEIMSECLDVSSPRLFSLHVAMQRQAQITMLNPDSQDIEETTQLMKASEVSRLALQHGGVEVLANPEMAGKFDAVWSISVVEHIEGSCTDSNAMKLMYQALKPGGRLMVTVPVDREFRIESSKHQQYGLQPRLPDGTYFFQRFYDGNGIRTRLCDPIGRAPDKIQWIGEKENGWWNHYRSSWDKRGMRLHVADPQEMIDNFCEFESWDKMPGMGICGLMFQKPLNAPKN